MLKVQDLTTSIEHGVPLKGISLEVTAGEVLVVIGPNGSGKSSLIETLSGYHSTFEGTVKLNHFTLRLEPDKTKSQFGYMPNPFVVERYLTGLEYLELVGAAHSLAPRSRSQLIKKYAEIFNCVEQLYTPLEYQGRAFIQKIGLIASLLHNPRVIMWDEPTNHLDFGAIQIVLEIIKELRRNKHSLLITTNNLEFAAESGDRFLLLDNGSVLAEGTLKQLVNQSKVEHANLGAIYQQYYS